MTRRILACALCVVGAGSCTRPDPPADPPHVLPFAAPALGPAHESTVDDAAIEALIASLAEIAKPDFGLSATLSGAAFPPVVGSERIGMMIYKDHDLDRSPALRRLVEIGPQAIPHLVQHIDDGAPTRLEVTHKGFGGAMWYDHELPSNPADESEGAALKAAGLPAGLEVARTSLSEHRTTNRHVVTVGDACFAVLGMITNRSYSAVRYVPSGCIAVNSPVEEPRLAGAVRRMWHAPDPRAALLERLLVDFHARGEGTDMLEDGAAMRLLYYFREESVPFILKRLTEKPLTDLDSQLVEAVAWSPEPAIREALRGIARPSGARQVVIACTPAMAGAADAAYLAKLRAMLLGSSTGHPYPTGDTQGLLSAIAELFPGQAAPVFREYLAAGGRESTVNVVEYLNTAHAELAPQVLVPCLDDTSDGMGYYPRDEAAAKEDKEQPRDVPLRICDDVFYIISGGLGDTNVEVGRSREEMDARIAALRKRLAAR